MIQSDVASGFSGITLAKVNDLLDSLDRAYPAFNGLWRINVNETGNVISVTNMALSNRNGFVMHIDKIDPEGKKVVRYAGELLERYRISRSSRVRQVIDDIGAAQRDFKGELVCDVS
jgi:hypothetical protein